MQDNQDLCSTFYKNIACYEFSILMIVFFQLSVGCDYINSIRFLYANFKALLLITLQFNLLYEKILHVNFFFFFLRCLMCIMMPSLLFFCSLRINDYAGKMFSSKFRILSFFSSFSDFRT